MRLKFTDEVYYFLHFACRESIIAQIILDGGSENVKDEGNFISKSDNESLSFLPVSKYAKVENPWKECRTSIKVGRFIRKFLTEFAMINFKINDAQVERFVNLYKSYFSRDVSKLKIVEGEELRKFYLEENYHDSNGLRYGTLWNSCMRQKERNRFLTLYEKNPNDVKMLVYFSDDNKIRARALLWQDVKEFNSINTHKFMDRIYYVYDHDVQFFKDWAKENGYLTKWEQNAKSEKFLDIDGNCTEMNLFVNLPIHNLPFAPYLDTFKFYNCLKGRFSNSDRYTFDYILVQSNGDYERPPDPDTEDTNYWDDEN